MAKPAPKAAPADAAAAPAKSHKLLIIIIALLVLIIVGGAGWYFTQGHAPAAEPVEEAKHAPAPQAKYVPLGEKFTVNLQQEEGDRYLQVGITLKVLDAKLEEEIKTAMPEIRSKLLLLLSGKKPSELVSVAGKQELVQQVIGEVNAVLGVASAPAAAVAEHGAEHAAPATTNPSGITDVLFTDFIIQ
ncbi:MAG: flagellar basal body-associated protein FliL [Sideroxydans sp.]